MPKLAEIAAEFERLKDQRKAMQDDLYKLRT